MIGQTQPESVEYFSRFVLKHMMQIYAYIWNHILDCRGKSSISLLKPTGHVMHQQFNVQQMYVLPTLYLYVLYLSENKQRLGPLTA